MSFRRGLLAAAALALATAAAPFGAVAQSPNCANPAGYCQKELETACLQRFGAGAIAVSPGAAGCVAQFEAYRDCLAEIAAFCPAEIEAGAPQTERGGLAGTCSAEDARAEWDALRTSDTVAMLQVFADYCEGTLQSDLAKARIADLIAPTQTAARQTPRTIDPTGFWTFTRNGRSTMHRVALLPEDRLQVANQLYVWRGGDLWKDEDATGTYEFLDAGAAVWRSNDGRGVEIALRRAIDPTGVWSFTRDGERRQNVFGILADGRLRVNNQVYVHVEGNVWKDEDATGTYEFQSENEALWRSNRSDRLEIRLKRDR